MPDVERARDIHRQEATRVHQRDHHPFELAHQHCDRQHIRDRDRQERKMGLLAGDIGQLSGRTDRLALWDEAKEEQTMTRSILPDTTEVEVVKVNKKSLKAYTCPMRLGDFRKISHDSYFHYYAHQLGHYQNEDKRSYDSVEEWEKAGFE